MRGFFLIFCIFIIDSLELRADSIPPRYINEEALQILKERGEKFSAYTESLDNTSGIFGTKTKKDLKNSQRILVEIVRLDNRLIAALNRRIDYHKFEDVSMNYSQAESEQRIAEMEKDRALSERKIASLNEEISRLNGKNRKQNIFIALLGLSCIVLLIKRKRRSAG